MPRLDVPALSVARAEIVLLPSVWGAVKDYTGRTHGADVLSAGGGNPAEKLKRARGSTGPQHNANRNRCLVAI